MEEQRRTTQRPAEENTASTTASERFLAITSVLGTVSRDSVHRQVGADVPGTDDGHRNPVEFDFGPQTVEVSLGGVFGGSVWPQEEIPLHVR